MQKYSDFFKTLHDEQDPTGHLGRGTHYSILRAVVFHDATGKSLPEARFTDFAVIWDEDHDDRVIEPIEKIYRCGLLPYFLMFGERKGFFTAILATEIYDQSKLSLLAERLSRITQQLDNGDSWPAHVVSLESSENPIISDSADKVNLYLNNLTMLWALGLKNPDSSNAKNLSSRPVRPTKQGVTLAIAKDRISFDVCVMLARDGERGTELKQLYRGRQSFAKALSMAQDFSEKSGFDGYYEITDETESAGKTTFTASAEWMATLTEIDRQLEPLKKKSGLNWTSKGGPITPADLARIPPVGPQLARLMTLRASLHHRRPLEL